MKNYFIIIIIALIFLSVQDKIFSQIPITLKVENYYDDNIYNNSMKASDFISSVSFSTGYNFESERNNLQFYYMNNFGYFNENLSKSSNSHKLGIVNTFLFAEDDNPLNIGINYSFRNNRDEYSTFDFNQLSLYANYRHSLSEDSFILLGYLFSKNDYKNLSVFSYNENKGFIKYSTTFSTKTTLLIGSEIYFKNYLENTADSSSKNGTSQLSLYLNLSQSLAEYSGLSGYFNLRTNLTSSTRYLYSGDLIFYEEEIFNDIYSNDGYDFGVAFTQILSSKISSKIEFGYSTRNFSNLQAATIDGYYLNENRNDKQYAVGIEFLTNLNSIITGLSASIKWNYIKNNSNDAFYMYDNQIFSISFEWGL